jgi:hypothetical protein
MSDRRRTTRSVPRAGTERRRHPVGSGSRSNTGLIIGGAAGGFVLVVAIIALAATGGARKPPPAASAAKAPQSAAELEEAGIRKCDEGLHLIQRNEFSTSDKVTLRQDLQRGVELITEGTQLLDRANRISNNKYDTTKYGQAMKLARGKLLELK